MCVGCRDLADNKVFFQHPDLMRSLGIHKTVMQLMVNTLAKAQQQSAASESEMASAQKRLSEASQLPPEALAAGGPPKGEEPILDECSHLLHNFNIINYISNIAAFLNVGDVQVKNHGHCGYLAFFKIIILVF